ncbi:putative rRNA methylase [Geothermobacter ehrlichii]|uniref:Putative rRNA methylase n=1 Tax=Geothermobacter ehrlichii TaxID=213224 RepID=A0A5D3WJ90_9BACT|nr:class I SAM-dependent methyltransferase [Geothermobacter ehrlichii]TYO98268.1 putative rRNA methylase [Geothermobacter ehrlichii]
MPSPGFLAQVTDWAHSLLDEIILPGDTLLDLTAGNGHDTLFLARRMGETGTLLAFDVQPAALAASERQLRAADFSPRRIDAPQRIARPGIYLIADSHHCLDRYLAAEVRAAIANLGYLPGSDKRVMTRPETTEAALRLTLDALAPGGRLAVVAYCGHPGGEEETAAVQALFAALPAAEFDVLQLTAANHRCAPLLLVAERRPVEIA